VFKRYRRIGDRRYRREIGKQHYSSATKENGRQDYLEAALVSTDAQKHSKRNAIKRNRDIVLGVFERSRGGGKIHLMEKQTKLICEKSCIARH